MFTRGTSRPSERRRNPRHRVHGPIDFRIAHWYPRRGRILNLCLEGCLIQPEQATDCVPGDTLELRFEINHLAFRARVLVRSIGASNRLGVEIIQLSRRNRQQLLQLIAELESAQPFASEK